MFLFFNHKSRDKTSFFYSFALFFPALGLEFQGPRFLLRHVPDLSSPDLRLVFPSTAAKMITILMLPVTGMASDVGIDL